MFCVSLSQPYFERVWWWNSHSQMGTWESFETPETSEFNCRGQNTSYLDVLCIIGNLSKCICQKWAHIGHLDICSTRYGKKKGRESNWQFDSWPLKVGNRINAGACSGMRYTVEKLSRRATSLFQTSFQSKVWAKSYDLAKFRESKPGQFRNSSLGVPGQKAIQT